jgi:hypothetical protein
MLSLALSMEWFKMPLVRWLASKLHFDPPLVFTTMNPADVEHPSYEMHEGAPIAIRCLYKVPICEDCHGTLSDTVPRLPKFSLANDLWLGCVPLPLASLSEGALLPLASASALIRRYTCKPDSGIMQERCQYIKGYVGNVCDFPQADGGLVLLSLPPNQQQVSEHILIAFVGSDEDMRCICKIVAEDPVAQALFSDMMMHLFLKHVLDVQPMCQKRFS